MTEMVTVIKPNFGPKRAAKVSRVCIPREEFEAEVKAAKEEKRPCWYALDKECVADEGKTFDQLSKAEQKKVLKTQEERAAKLEEEA